MNRLGWLIRMRRWAQHPPPASRVKLVLGVGAACLVIAGFEYVFGWPAWLTMPR